MLRNLPKLAGIILAVSKLKQEGCDLYSLANTYLGGGGDWQCKATIKSLHSQPRFNKVLQCNESVNLRHL